MIARICEELFINKSGNDPTKYPTDVKIHDVNCEHFITFP